MLPVFGHVCSMCLWAAYINFHLHFNKQISQTQSFLLQFQQKLIDKAIQKKEKKKQQQNTLNIFLNQENPLKTLFQVFSKLNRLWFYWLMHSYLHHEVPQTKLGYFFFPFFFIQRFVSQITSQLKYKSDPRVNPHSSSTLLDVVFF